MELGSDVILEQNICKVSKLFRLPISSGKWRKFLVRSRRRDFKFARPPMELGSDTIPELLRHKVSKLVRLPISCGNSCKEKV